MAKSGHASRPILVVKIGTHALLGEHEVPSHVFEVLAGELRRLMDEYRIVLVTSGAIGFGVRALGLRRRPHDIDQLQALAMIGQTGLLQQWRDAFGDTLVGQVLVTRRDMEQVAAAHTLAQSIEAVWAYGAMPIVNENDAVSHEEISFGDNDQLAAEIAAALGAAQLILLTDQDGVQANFGTPSQQRIGEIRLDEMSKHINPTRSRLGKGGFESKVLAAMHALRAGVSVHIGHLSATSTLADILSGKSGTRIVQ